MHPLTRPALVRIASLLPSATEIVCALGLEDQLVLRSHECDFPPGVARLPFVTEPKYAADGTSYQIDERIRALLQEGLSVYRVDADGLRDARPDVIVTQHQCEVCAVSARELEAAACAVLDPPPGIVSLAPGGLADVLSDMERVAAALGVADRGAALVAGLRERMEAVEARVKGWSAGRAATHRPSVVTLEWLDPLMVAGNWVPELVEMAGGTNLLGEAGAHSPFVDWEEVRELDPDVVVVLPCGFTLHRTRQELHLLAELPGWTELRAVRRGRVALADGHHFFNRPGPRVVESLEILAEILHPDMEGWGHQGTGWSWMEG